MDNIRFVAEFTTNPMGNLNVLLRMVKKAAEAGCTLIKMQKKDVDSFYTQEKLNTPFESPYGKTYRDYREIFEFDEEQFQIFDRECQKYGIGWFSTAQDIPSLKFLAEFDLPIYKVASSNVGNDDLLREIAANIPKSKEIVFSVGGAEIDRIERTLNMLSGFRKVTILHCVAEYPCPNEHCKLGNITELRRRFESTDVAIGYSGHEEGYKPTLAAIALGAKMIERHICLSRASFVHHIECSLEPEEYTELISIVKSAKNIDELSRLYNGLPETVFACDFSMSEKEREFIVEGKYGTKYITKKSHIYQGE
jgi:N-acetylneuraminate synthase